MKREKPGPKPEKEKSTGEVLEETRRKKQAKGENTGGMGRSETPKDGKSQGNWGPPEH